MRASRTQASDCNCCSSRKGEPSHERCIHHRPHPFPPLALRGPRNKRASGNHITGPRGKHHQKAGSQQNRRQQRPDMRRNRAKEKHKGDATRGLSMEPTNTRCHPAIRDSSQLKKGPERRSPPGRTMSPENRSEARRTTGRPRFAAAAKDGPPSDQPAAVEPGKPDGPEHGTGVRSIRSYAGSFGDQQAPALRLPTRVPERKGTPSQGTQNRPAALYLKHDAWHPPDAVYMQGSSTKGRLPLREVYEVAFLEQVLRILPENAIGCVWQQQGWDVLFAPTAMRRGTCVLAWQISRASRSRSVPTMQLGTAGASASAKARTLSIL